MSGKFSYFQDEDDINEDDEEEARDFTLSCFFFGVFVKACDKCV